MQPSRRRPVVLELIALFFLGTLAASGAQPAFASTKLPFTGFGDMVVDDAHSRVFVAGPGDNHVVVLGFNEAIQAEIDMGEAPDGLVLLGTTLYVSLPTSNSVATVDIDTLAKTATIALPGTMNDPGALEYSSGLVWIGWGQYGAAGGIASLDPATNSVTVYGTDTLTWLPSTDPSLLADPALPDRLFIWDTTGSDLVVEMDTSTTPPTKVAATPSIYHGVADAAVTPDGSGLIVVSSRDHDLLSFATSDLSSTGQTYNMGLDASTAVAVASTGEIVSAGEGATWGFHPGTSAAFYTQGGGALKQALAVSGDGVRGFRVSGGQFSTFFPEQVATALRLNVSANRIHYGDAVKLHLQLDLGKNATNRTVRIYEGAPYGKKRILASVKVGADGSHTASIKPKYLSTYWATYAGDPFDQPATSKARPVSVYAAVSGKLGGYYATSNGYRLYHFAPCSTTGKSCLTFTIHVGPNRAGKSVDYSVQEFAGGAWRYIFGGGVKLSNKSIARVRLSWNNPRIIGYRLRIRGSFDADNRNLAGASDWANFRITS